MTQPETKDRILDAAEHLFSEQGITGVSLRAITSAAEANLAAVNYHFGSKEGLIKAVLARRIDPVNARRLELLDALEAQRDPTLEEVLTALLRPAVEMSSDPTAGAFCSRLLGRVQSEAEPTFREFCADRFKEIVARFQKAISQSCPHLDAAALTWRFQFMIGALGFTLTDALNLHQRSNGLCDPRDAQDTTAQLVHFAAAGFRAALVPSPPATVAR